MATMRLLILSVDRDDDLGRKTSIRAPVVGRKAMVEAAQALIIADPEESDANGMFAAVHEYDDIVADPAAYGAESVEVAHIGGHVRVGPKSDAILAQQLTEVLTRTRSDAVILVSDGGEDDHILPLLNSRATVNGVRRVIVKQSKNLEGFLYLFSRLMSDEKMQRRFFLPLAFLLVAAGVSILLERPELFLSSALILAAFLILVQVFAWQEGLGKALSRIGEELRAGKLSLFASFLSLMIIIVGGLSAVGVVENRVLEGRGVPEWAAFTLYFADAVFWWIVTAVLVILGGRAIDQWIRLGLLPRKYLEAMVFFLSGAVAFDAALLVATTRVEIGAWSQIPNFQTFLLDLFTRIFIAGFLFFAGLIALHYFQHIVPAKKAKPQDDPGK